MEVFVVIDTYGNKISHKLGTVEAVYLNKELAYKYIKTMSEWGESHTLTCLTLNVRLK
jgi:hypothetical protein